jgi:hypothetical protein
MHREGGNFMTLLEMAGFDGTLNVFAMDFR